MYCGCCHQSSLSDHPSLIGVTGFVISTMIYAITLALVAFQVFSISSGFVVPTTRTTRCVLSRLNAGTSWNDKADGDWTLLAPGVWKQTVSEGDGQAVDLKNDDSSVIEISYKGTLVGEDWWSAQDVADCWISELQGMEIFAPTLVENNVNGAMLLNPESFTEDFVKEMLGDTGSKIQCKKLGMAARRLQKVRDDFPIGLEFDANENFEITPNKRIIRGMRLGIENMTRVGETTKIICRSDYAYGGEGMRRNNGDVLVPPFAALCFEVSLLNVKGAA